MTSFFDYEKANNELINQLKIPQWAATVEAILSRQVSTFAFEMLSGFGSVETVDTVLGIFVFGLQKFLLRYCKGRVNALEVYSFGVLVVQSESSFSVCVQRPTALVLNSA